MAAPVTELRFSVWAPDKQTFIDSWVAAGILELDKNSGEYVYTPEYPGMQTNMKSWSGIIVKTPGTYDEDGNELTAPVMVPGWHTNVWVNNSGGLVDEMTYGLDQYESKPDKDGNPVLKSVLDRTHAVQLFGLSSKAKNSATNFPAGRESSAGVVYTDSREFSSPSNVWA